MGVVKGLTLSNATKSTEYNKIQESQTAILDGRFNPIQYENTLPIQSNFTILPLGSSLPSHKTLR